MSEIPQETYPVFDTADLALFGWEIAWAEDGMVVLRSTCAGCGETHEIQLRPGAYLEHWPPGNLHAEDVQFAGRMKPAEHTEP